MNYARRQQYRRLSRATSSAAVTAAALLLALVLVSMSAPSLAAILLLVAVALGLYSRHWFVLAGRSRVGARSEDEVQRALDPLRGRGWRVRHSLPWRGCGDIDSVAVAPSGLALAIETKTKTYDDRHLARVRAQAAWLSRRQRRWCGEDVLPVLCVVRARGVQRWEGDVLVVSIDRLVTVLEMATHPIDVAAFVRG